MEPFKFRTKLWNCAIRPSNDTNVHIESISPPPPRWSFQSSCYLSGHWLHLEPGMDRHRPKPLPLELTTLLAPLAPLPPLPITLLARSRLTWHVRDRLCRLTRLLSGTVYQYRSAGPNAFGAIDRHGKSPVTYFCAQLYSLADGWMTGER